MTKLILIRGLVGTGKTTYAQKFFPSFVNCEIEDFFTKDGGYYFEPSKIKDAHLWCTSQVRYYLNQGEDVTVAATFCKKWEMMSYIGAGIKYNADIEIVECHEYFGNPHNVPAHVKNQLKQSWEDFELQDLYDKYYERHDKVVAKNNLRNIL